MNLSCTKFMCIYTPDMVFADNMRKSKYSQNSAARL